MSVKANQTSLGIKFIFKLKYSELLSRLLFNFEYEIKDKQNLWNKSLNNPSNKMFKCRGSFLGKRALIRNSSNDQ